MSDTIYIVRYIWNTDPTDRSTQELVRAAHVETDGNCVLFTHSDGTVKTYFDKKIILDWRIITEDELATL